MALFPVLPTQAHSKKTSPQRKFAALGAWHIYDLATPKAAVCRPRPQECGDGRGEGSGVLRRCTGVCTYGRRADERGEGLVQEGLGYVR